MSLLRSCAPVLLSTLAALASTACASTDPADSSPPGTTPPGTTPPETMPDPPTCDPGAADGIEVTETDIYGAPPYALGYPPYAIDGCLLAYVARPAAGASAGALFLRDLATGSETELASASEEPRRPAVGGHVIAWEATEGGARVVRVRSGDVMVTVTGPFHHAGEPRATIDGVVLTAWLGPDDGGDTDVYWFDPGAPGSPGAIEAVATGPGQQRFADITSTHIAFTDFAEDPDGRFDQNALDLSDIVVVDRASGVTSPRARVGKQAFPMLGLQGKLAYLGWDPDHPEPKFGAYDLYVGEVSAPADSDALAAHVETLSPYIRPAAQGSLLEWVARPLGSSAASLWRRRADLSTPAEKVPDLDGLELFGPSASATITVAAARNASGLMSLRAIAR